MDRLVICTKYMDKYKHKTVSTYAHFKAKLLPLQLGQNFISKVTTLYLLSNIKICFLLRYKVCKQESFS